LIFWTEKSISACAIRNWWGKSMAQFQEDEIRQTVIKMYQDLILKQKVLKIKSKVLGDGRVNMQMVERISQRSSCCGICKDN
jgi:tRNA(Ser,Leu) C12 N-acetylase TAN1